LAARAMLGDLERGESSIHFKADKLFDEGEAVRSEGERLGCKWKLASKWTSFCAVEEFTQTSSPGMLTRLPLRNSSNTIFESVSQSDLGLLRPRGMRLGNTLMNHSA